MAGCFTTITRYSGAFQVLVSQVDVHQEYTWPKLWLMQVNWMGRIRHVMEAEDNHFQVGGHMLGAFLQSMSSLGAWEIRLICSYFAFDIISCCHGGGWLLSYNKIGCDYSDMKEPRASQKKMKDRSRCRMSICVGHIMDALCHHCFISCQQFGIYRYICGSIDVSIQCPRSAVQGGYPHGSTWGSWRTTLLDAWQDAERPRRHRMLSFIQVTKASL